MLSIYRLIFSVYDCAALCLLKKKMIFNDCYHSVCLPSSATILLVEF